MCLFSSSSQRICLVVSTDIKLNKSHSSIICLAVFFDFCCLHQFAYHPVRQLSRVTTSWSIQNISSALKLRNDFRDATWNFKFFIHCSLAHILGHHHYFHPHFFGNFRQDFKCQFWLYFWKISVVVAEKYLHISSGIFFYFKTLNLDWFMWSGRKLFPCQSWG